MSPEEMQRTMQFLVHQQTQFAAELARHAAESVAWRTKFEASMTSLSEKTDQIADGLLGLTAIVRRVVDKVGRLTDEQRLTQQQLRETDSGLSGHIQRVESHIQRVETHLDAVVDLFDRYLREDHGHKPS